MWLWGMFDLYKARMKLFKSANVNDSNPLPVGSPILPSKNNLSAVCTTTVGILKQ